MRHAMILGLCIVTTACQSTGSSPIAPSSSAITATPTQSVPRPNEVTVQALRNGGPVEVTFTKWITTFPNMEGVTGKDVEGTFEGEVLQATPFDNGVIVKLNARYTVVDPTGNHTFTAIIQGTQNNQTKSAVLNGVVTDGWLEGSQVHVDFDIITPCESLNRCFKGTIRVMPNSAN